MKTLTKWVSGGLVLLASSAVQADIVHADDVIITSSLCTGFDCVNGEAFGADTSRLKENNLRIHFDDTSNSGSFAANDWRIVINDQENGGANYFGVQDASAGRMVFRLGAGAPANSLVVDEQGDVGMGTLTPVVELHMVDGDTPTLRLEQNGSSGFTAQTWDVAGNETNFFVRDVTGGSDLVFRIKSGAPEDSLFIKENGDIGLGTDTPAEPLHLVKAGPARFKLTNSTIVNSASVDKDWIFNSNGSFRISAGSDSPEMTLTADAQMGIGTVNPQDDIHVVDNGPARLRLTNTTKSPSATEDPDWSFNSNGTLRISAGADASELTLTADGNLTVTGGYFVNATQLSVPDYVFESSYDLKSIEEQAEYMFSNKHLPAVKAAPPSEGQLDLVSQQLGMLEELEKAHIYISYLHERMKVMEENKVREMSLLEERLAKLEGKVADSN